MAAWAIGVPIPNSAAPAAGDVGVVGTGGAVGVNGEGGEPPDVAATKRRRAAAGDAAAAEDAMVAPEVDMATIDLLS